MTELETERKITDRQYGFRPGKSTVDPIILRIKGKINQIRTKAYRNRKFCVLIALDIKTAFNTANWTGIIEEMEKNGIIKKLKNLVASYLSRRTIVYEGD